MSEQKHYGHYDDSIMDDDWYAKHVFAMTAEKLHGKAEIAAELAFRDRRIATLEALLKARDGGGHNGDCARWVFIGTDKEKPCSCGHDAVAAYFKGRGE